MELLCETINEIGEAHLAGSHGAAHQFTVEHILLTAPVAENQSLRTMQTCPEILQQAVVESRDRTPRHTPLEPIGVRCQTIARAAKLAVFAKKPRIETTGVFQILLIQYVVNLAH